MNDLYYSRFILTQPLKKDTFDAIPGTAIILAVVASVPPNAGVVGCYHPFGVE
jgi:bifunctional DNase/RNase